ncbi:hypothetical protein ABIB15_002940 [Marisediminicola sp. UYEF4]|uniref:hypothetical protein n=1 Tax=Marisediminicola sp. UYEF4 TaxID=1756384 RepID=UPI00339194E2
MPPEYDAGDTARRARPFNAHSTYGMDPAATAYYRVVSEIDGEWTIIPLAPLMPAPEIEVLRGFKPHGDDTALRALLEASDPDFDATGLTTAQLQSVVSGWEAASRELSEEAAQFLRVVFFDFDGKLRAELLETGIEMPYCDLGSYRAAVYTYLTDAGGRSDDEAEMEVTLFLDLIKAHHRAHDPSSVPAKKIMSTIIREAYWVA